MSKSFRRTSLSVAAVATGCAAIAVTAVPANAATTTTTTTTTATAATAGAATSADNGYGSHAVFVQTDNTAGNQVVSYQRAADGTLKLAHTYATGGLGGVLTGSAVDHTASQGALTYDAEHHLLYAVNAGSNTVSVFAVHGTALTLEQVVSSGGTFPVSVAVHRDVVYVLNAADGASVQGYRVSHGRLQLRTDWNRPLGLDATGTPQFTHTPGQVGFTGDGRQLVVTTKAASNDVLVYRLGHDGAPAQSPTVNSFPGTVPFAFVNTGRDQIALVQAGTNSVLTYRVGADGTLTQQSAYATGQAATCWIARAGDLLFASNAGSATETGLRLGTHDALTGLGTTKTDMGTVDAAAAGHNLYVQTGATGIVDEYSIAPNGTLTAIGSVTVAGAAGGEGIAAN
ncbi:beta-propeller fold lactonase family protein [Catenulispora sp. NL8]|uniref:Beta-propeller fold lactonase family protein n=1 Tax=Catenulispora pinistramenti TaxID=2705254 RepID=A0ABS5KVF2_9ACTN|nr:beta-propeller fold lactonase family protein [Catenulispora pinistramenti]MBS2550046.1 beta-propeller fold lactonase family protein [Catenulispora pinistramenti]